MKTEVEYRVVDPVGRRLKAWFPPFAKHLECIAGPVGEGVPVVVVCRTRKPEPPKMARDACHRARVNGYRNVVLEVAST